MNIVHMSSNKKKHYLIITRDDFFDWAETRALLEARTWRVTKFLWKDVICRHDCFEKLTVNDESENKEILDELVQRYRIKKMITSSYHSQINEMIKRNHKSLFDALFKMFDEELKSWIDNLHVVLWADRFTVKFITDLISFYLQCDSESMLLIELEISIWRILFWQEMHTIEDLLTMRARQLQRKNENMNEAKDLLKRMRKQDKKYFD
jgi:DNA-directed RNA polymerase subunit N (RpoN/RPB10)